MKVFISGPMRDYENNNEEMFNACEKKLREYGFSVFNPAWLKYDSKWDRKDMLELNICALNKCDAICHLPGWEKASGAVLEDSYAQTNNYIDLEYEEDGYIYLVLRASGVRWDIEDIPSNNKRNRVNGWRYAFDKMTELDKWMEQTGEDWSEIAKLHYEKHHTRISPDTLKMQALQYGVWCGQRYKKNYE